jgi:hypothetical protein
LKILSSSEKRVQPSKVVLPAPDHPPLQRKGIFVHGGDPREHEELLA